MLDLDSNGCVCLEFTGMCLVWNFMDMFVLSSHGNGFFFWNFMDVFVLDSHGCVRFGISWTCLVWIHTDVFGVYSQGCV